LIFGGLALSVDLLLGHVGLLPLGQALFFGLGAYVSALVLTHWEASFWLAIAVSVVFCALAGLIGGLIAIRSKGVYFALISFGLAQVVSKVVYNTRELGASDGMTGVPVVTVVPGVQTDSPLGFFIVTWLVIGGLYLGLRYLMQTPMGRLFSAVRVNEHRVAFLGFDAWRFKLTAFVAAAVVAGLSGALYPMLRGFVSPELMFFQVSGNAVVQVILGGSGTLIGALYGSGLLTVLKSMLGSFTAHHHIVIGVLFVVVVIAFPRGIAGYLIPMLEARLSKNKKGGQA
jgi:branched-chain amino acid transport system permease protein